MQARLQTAEAAGRAAGLRASKDPTIRVDDELQQLLSSGKPTSFVIEFKERADLSAAHAMTGASQWQARGRYVFEQLSQVAERSQRDVREFLSASGKSFEPFWVTNVIVVKDGDQNTVQSLLTFREIAALRIYKPFDLIRPEPAPAGPELKVVGSNIAWIGADQVWASGYTGTGITVASIDTGVRYTHEALVGSYRGNLGGGSFNHDYHWRNPYDNSAVPSDSDDHGSHVTGTMVGDDATSTNQIGVAPGAKWIACRGFNPGATDAGLLGCGQFMVAPTRTDGSDPDPDMRPHVVNNSWGDCGTSYDNWYEGVIDAWIAAGIVPVFANGNASNCGYSQPPGLNTVGNPARSKKVLGVGSSQNANGQYATHSNWGPTDDTTALTPDVHPDLMGFDQLKPNIIAPGQGVRSATRGSDSSYANFTGTSMSAPHVAGLVALMWNAAPCLIGDYARTGTIMSQTARPIDYNSGGTPPPGPGNIPNYATGWGEIDAVDAVDAAIGECGPQGFIAGTVTEAGSGNPIPDARVEIEDMVNNRTVVLFTDANGQYSRRMPEIDAGGHVVSVSKYGYVGDSESGVLVEEDETTTLDFQLELADSFTVSGTVTDATTGWALPARIDIAGFPGSPVWTDPLTGQYSVELVAGVDYGLVASSVVDGYLTDSDSLPALGADEIVDFGLGPNPLTCAAPGYEPTSIMEYGADFEGNDGGFTSSGANNQWAWGTPTTWPSACASGSSCWGTNLNGNYANSANMVLLSPVIDLSGLSPDTALQARWQQAHHIESATWDQAFAEVSINGGPWTQMWAHDGGTVQVGWTQRTFNVSAAAGGTAQFRWRLITDSSVAYSGLYVDDVVIAAASCTSPSGDMLIGTVRDANTSAGLNGAAVSVDGGMPVASAATAHPALAGGFYAAYAAPGASSVEGDGSPVHPGYGTDTAGVAVTGGITQQIDLDIPAGQLAFSPAAGPSVTLPLGAVSQSPFQVSNSGTADADFNLLGVGLSEQFETGFPPVGWTSSNNGGTAGCVWRTNAQWGLPNYAGGIGLAAAASSDGCGNGTTMDTSLISPRIDLSNASNAALGFILSYRHFGTSRFDVDVSINDGASWTNIYTRNVSTSATGPGTPVDVDLGAHVGSSQTRLRFRYVSPGWNWWAMVDQVNVYGDFSLIPWLSLNPPPTGGSLGLGGSRNFTATFDAGSFGQPGVVTAPILVQHDTPYAVAPRFATMTMTAPASFGTVNGTVQGLGRCDASPAPAVGASVSIIGRTRTFETTTDANGEFSWQLDSAEAPLTVVARAPGHVDGQVGGVMLTAGGTASADLDLRAELPCLDVAPGSLAATLEQGSADARDVVFSNSGAGALGSWSVTIGGEPGALSSALVSQTVSQTPEALTGIHCGSGGVHAENFYLRRYSHAEFGVDGPAPITHVEFAVETAAASGGGTQAVEVRLYSLDGAFTFANMTLLDSKVVNVPDQSLGNISVELDAPVMLDPGDEVVAVLYLPTGSNHSFFPGANGAGQSAPTFIAASACGIDDPTDLAGIGFPNSHLILNLRTLRPGESCENPTPVDWLLADPTSGGIAADTNSTVQALFDAAGVAIGSHASALCISSSDAGAAELVIPVDMEVVAAVPVADLAVSIGDSADPVQAGSPLTYTVTVENLGPDTTSSVQVLVTLPAESTYLGNSAGAACIEAGATLDCDFSDALAMGEGFSFTIDMTAGVPGVQQIGASVSSADSTDLDAGNNAATEHTTITPAPSADLAISVNGPAGPVLAGTQAQYLVKVANLGGDPVTGVTVSLGWPADLVFDGFSGTGWNCTGGAGSATCTLGGSQASGFAPDLVVGLMVDAAATGGARTVIFAVAADQADDNPGNNSTSIDTDVVALPLGDHIFGNGFED